MSTTKSPRRIRYENMIRRDRKLIKALNDKGVRFVGGAEREFASVTGCTLVDAATVLNTMGTAKLLRRSNIGPTLEEHTRRVAKGNAITAEITERAAYLYSLQQVFMQYLNRFNDSTEVLKKWQHGV